MADDLTITFFCRREDGSEDRADPIVRADYIARLGIESIAHEVQINGESVWVGFDFDPPVVPKNG